MTLLINEIVFKGQVTQPDKRPEKASPGKSSKPVDQKAVIDACVEAVVRILERREER